MTMSPRTGTVLPLAVALRDARDALAREPLPDDLAARVLQQWALCQPDPLAGPTWSAVPHAAALPPPGLAAGGRALIAGAGRAASLLQPLWQRWLAGSGAALCLVALTLSVVLMLSAPPLPAPPGAAAPASGFLPVVSAQRLAELAAADVGPSWVVPGEWPRERLAAFGLPYDPARAGETVRAELLVHASGDVLAVRLLAQ
ncbi:MAG: hypothetical protein ACKVQR_02750 [Aquabacterium sp.]